jgi:molybdenum cofactor synthesis domain-containing protein
MRVAIVTISDSDFTGDRSDTSGEAIRLWCESRGDQVVSHDKVSDETSEISPLLASLCDSGSVDLLLTTGGTGLSPRDVTPEATRAVIERDAPGIAEFIRSSSYDKFPRAALSRGVAGTRGGTLVVNLPGSTSGVRDGLACLLQIVDHAVGVLSGSVGRHDNPERLEKVQ